MPASESSGGRPQLSRRKKKLELYKLVVARSDISICWRTCELVLERVSGHEDPLFQPLFYAAVISYGRPFEGNKTTGPLSRHWSDYREPRLREMHRRLMETRHGLVAHSDVDVRTMMIHPPGTLLPRASKPTKSVSIELAGYFFPRVMFVDTRDACLDLFNRLNERIDVLLDELYESQGLPVVSTNLTFDDGL